MFTLERVDEQKVIYQIDNISLRRRNTVKYIDGNPLSRR